MGRTYLQREAFVGAVKAGTVPADAVLRKQYVPDTIRAVEAKDATTPSRSRQFIISTATVDRDNDSVSPKGWQLENYKKNPVVLFAHDYSSLPVAKCTDVRFKGNALVATAEFADHEMANTVLRLIDGGFLNATSVGFRPIKFVQNEQRRGMDFTEQELLEFSIVPVPANPDALIVARELVGDVETLKAWATKTITVLDEAIKAADKPKPDAAADDDTGAADDKPAAEDDADADDAKKPFPFKLSDDDVTKIAAAVMQSMAEAKASGCPCTSATNHDPKMCSCCSSSGSCQCSDCRNGTGDDISLSLDTAITKRGRVLSAANETKIRAACGHLNDVLKALPSMDDATDDGDKGLLDIDLVAKADDDGTIDDDMLQQVLRETTTDVLRAAVRDAVATGTKDALRTLRGRLD